MSVLETLLGFHTKKSTLDQIQRIQPEMLLKTLYLFFMFLLCSAAHVGAEDPRGATDIEVKQEQVPSTDELLVRFTAGASVIRINEINESLNVKVMRTLRSGRVYLVKPLADQSSEDLIKAYSAFAEVESVAPNVKIRPE